MLFAFRSNLKKLLIACLALGSIWLVYYFSVNLRGDQIYRFEGVTGPSMPAVIAAEVKTPWSDYDQGEPSRLAILLTDPDSAWLGLAHGLKAIGVPFRITRDYQQALKHKAILVYPNISGATLKPNELQALAQFARERGALIGSHVLGGGMNALFGFDQAISAKHSRVKFDTTAPLAMEFTESKETTIAIGNADATDTLVGTYHYSQPQNPPIAVFEDGSAAITQKHFEHGHAYALGVDLGFLLLKGYNNREEGIARSYVNDFEPTLDVLLRLIKNIYLEANPNAITLWTVPFGKSLSVVISHDIDYNESLKNAVTYAEFEHQQGIPSTHFIQTKYIKDWNDEIFFNEQGVQYLKQLQSLGVEIASHSVSHSGVLSKIAPGTGHEQYPTYQPFVKTKTQTNNATVLGELRVSKFLLDQFAPTNTVVSFRPGYLQNPFSLAQSLQATGYRYSSSVTANSSLTHLPFRLNFNRGFINETLVYEFPVTIEDERISNPALWLKTSTELAQKISRYGGSFVALIHTNVVGEKLAFEKQLVAAIKPYSWFGSMRTFGDWWTARDVVEVDVTESAALGTQTLTLKIPKPVTGLTVQLPIGKKLLSVEPTSVQVKQTDRNLVFENVQGMVTVTIGP
jgi:Polysaccharide deacetylase